MSAFPLQYSPLASLTKNTPKLMSHMLWLIHRIGHVLSTRKCKMFKIERIIIYNFSINWKRTFWICWVLFCRRELFHEIECALNMQWACEFWPLTFFFHLDSFTLMVKLELASLWFRIYNTVTSSKYIHRQKITWDCTSTCFWPFLDPPKRVECVQSRVCKYFHFKGFRHLSHI